MSFSFQEWATRNNFLKASLWIWFDLCYAISCFQKDRINYKCFDIWNIRQSYKVLKMIVVPLELQHGAQHSSTTIRSLKSVRDRLSNLYAGQCAVKGAVRDGYKILLPRSIGKQFTAGMWDAESSVVPLNRGSKMNLKWGNVHVHAHLHWETTGEHV